MSQEGQAKARVFDLRVGSVRDGIHLDHREVVTGLKVERPGDAWESERL